MSRVSSICQKPNKMDEVDVYIESITTIVTFSITYSSKSSFLELVTTALLTVKSSLQSSSLLQAHWIILSSYFKQCIDNSRGEDGVNLHSFYLTQVEIENYLRVHTSDSSPSYSNAIGVRCLTTVLLLMVTSVIDKRLKT